MEKFTTFGDRLVGKWLLYQRSYQNQFFVAPRVSSGFIYFLWLPVTPEMRLSGQQYKTVVNSVALIGHQTVRSKAKTCRAKNVPGKSKTKDRTGLQKCNCSYQELGPPFLQGPNCRPDAKSFPRCSIEYPLRPAPAMIKVIIWECCGACCLWPEVSQHIENNAQYGEAITSQHQQPRDIESDWSQDRAESEKYTRFVGRDYVRRSRR